MSSEKTMVEQLAEWAHSVDWNSLSDEAKEGLKGRVLDSVGTAIGALNGEPVRNIRRMTEHLGDESHVTLIGGGKTTPDYATFYNGAAVRYPDFNDSYLAKEETGHPSNNIAPVLAAAEYAGTSGKDFLLALAVAYQVQCRLSDVAPARKHGFDHTVQGAYGAAAGAARAMKLHSSQIANAISIAGTGYNSLRVTRTGELSNWKGLAYPNTAMGAVHASMLAKYGITGPREVFEGNKGLMDSIADDFTINWEKEDLERVTDTIIKRFNAEIHSQSSIEGLLEIRSLENIKPENIKEIRLTTFDVAYNIIGGGEEGSKKLIRYKEEADHSLPYMLAAAYLDGQVMPEQYEPERIMRDDIQDLLQKVDVQPNDEYSSRFPDEMACRIELETQDGRIFNVEKRDYQGFKTQPASWDVLMEKYNKLTRDIDSTLAAKIADTIKNLENVHISELTETMDLKSTCLLITARSSSWRCSAAASGAPRTCGDVSLRLMKMNKYTGAVDNRAQFSARLFFGLRKPLAIYKAIARINVNKPLIQPSPFLKRLRFRYNRQQIILNTSLSAKEGCT
ncbi:MmgE/PrpD family protein [Lentibacillus jeotgali]|uniref:MmgE/PrpD family protein n=1 Tax=Lentibacillus jeotgali TaxID=558169 RepID=UPI0002625CD2|nr:MmgE/PrpD family protein [Lentibacillus jeotgali]